MNNSTLKPHFTYFKQKIQICELLYWITYAITQNIQLYKLKHKTINISKNTIYNFNNKIAKLKVFDMYHKYITNEYFNLTEGQNKIFHIDSTLILNKLGVDAVSFNCQIHKHKTSKISVVVDNFSFPIDIIIEDGKTHDSKIAAEHLLNMKEKFENIMDNENLMFGDAAYDSNVLRTIAKDIKFGK